VKLMKIKRKIADLLSFIPIIKAALQTRLTHTPITLRMWVIQKLLGENRSAYWPVHHSSMVTSPQRILAGVETSPAYMPGCYIQGRGGIVIGDYTQISCNVGIISGNHNFYDCRKHDPESFPSVKIGAHGWIGMNSMILPGVNLGDFTIVGAGSVVTKSFPEGHCVIAGNPARVIKHLDRSKCERYKSEFEYHGYIPKVEFDEFRKRCLEI
jgi:acetyltransferase-like isoleucine patch superfamily enzyme